MVGDAEHAPRKRDAGVHVRAVRGDRARAAEVYAADEAPTLEPVPAEEFDDISLASGQLEIDVGTAPRRLLGKETQRVVEGGGLAIDVRLRMSDHELAVGSRDDVELDEVDPDLDCDPERAKRVLAGEARRSAVTDA